MCGMAAACGAAPGSAGQPRQLQQQPEQRVAAFLVYVGLPPLPGLEQLQESVACTSAGGGGGGSCLGAPGEQKWGKEGPRAALNPVP